MNYYNRSYQKINLKRSDMKHLKSGECARVLYNDDIVLKEYFFGTSLYFRLKAQMFDILRTINHPHFIKLFEVYCNYNLLGLLGSKINIVPFVVDSYTAKYYPADPINVLYEDKDYILDNFRELESLFEIFTDNLICTDDVKRANTVLNRENIIIIDPDLFYKTTRPKEEIATLNKKKLLNLFRSICMDCAKNQPYYGNMITWIDNELVDIEVTENTDITYEISKKLKYVRKPIEGFKK